MLKEDFLTRLQADAVKELGFFKPCIGVYRDDDVVITVNPKDHYYYEDSAPTKSQVFRWFREKYDFDIPYIQKLRKLGVVFYYCQVPNTDISFRVTSYEEAESACIDRLIEIVKEQKDGE